MLAGRTTTQVKDAPQGLQTRTREHDQPREKQKDAAVTHMMQSEVESQSHPAQSLKISRPRARLLNRDGAQTSSNPLLQPQSGSNLQSAASCHANSRQPSGSRDTTDNPSGAGQSLERKRRHSVSHDEPNSDNKKRKTSDQRRAKATKKSSPLGANITEQGSDT